MKRLIIFILLFLGLIGCSGIKKTAQLTDKSKSDVDIKTSGEIIAKNDSSIVNKTNTEETKKIETDRNEKKNDSVKTITRYIYFDTSKPLTAFGTPPVSSIFENSTQSFSNTQISENEKQSLGKKIEADIKKEYENRYNEKFNSLLNLIERQNIKLTEKEKKGTSPWRIFVFGVLTPFLAKLIYFLIKKLKILGYI
ncbi:exported hypothetical protein [uncultured Paludibacter sp.]|uniref:Lipoprotein n=1 Tax=uncultured Paludibacter sp. TaxID=497635 RepID=A0A653AB09_9BACT|nr:exported hypothetical protein [uncultured Paludibacter sp.]